MEEYNRIIIENYLIEHPRMTHLQYLIEASYDLSFEGTDDDALYLERLINRTQDEELYQALIDLDNFLFRW